MKIVLTGAAGRIGRAVGKRLVSEGLQVIGLDLRTDESLPYSVRVGDVTDLEALIGLLEGADGVVHLAAVPGPRFAEPHLVFATNVLGTFNMLEGCRKTGVRRVVMASSVNAVGLHYNRCRPRLDYLPLDEDHPARPEEAYSLSKWFGELAADATARLMPEICAVSLRFHGVISDTALERLRQNPITEIPGDYKGLWGYVHIDDVVRSVLKGLQAQWTGHQTFFICARDTHSAVPTPLLLKAAYPDVPLKRPIGDFAGLFDISKAKRLLGWEPSISWRAPSLRH